MCKSGVPDNWKVETSQLAVPYAYATHTSPVSRCVSHRVRSCKFPQRASTWKWASRCSLKHLRPLLPRKEVIQPHLPVRLPCYDFTPITNPTLDACLPPHRGLAQRLQVLPTFVV